MEYTKQDCIRPGKEWLDTKGERIHAHGGSVMYWDGAYYWYGENHKRTDRPNGICHWGVRCYRSTDLYNWEDLGTIIPPDLDDPTSPLHPSSKTDRPHIIYNPLTKKFVCWLKIMEPGGPQSESILVADRLTGPYTLVRQGLYPLGMSGGDFDLAVAPDGRAYYYFERVHSEIICADLTEDYTDVTGDYSTHFPQVAPPFVREAPAHFMHEGKHYLFTSGTTSYWPNPSEVAIADTWHGPYTVLGDPHPTDESHTSFHSQISCVFKVEGKKDLYIAMADRWIPRDAEVPYEAYGPAWEVNYSPASTLEERLEARKTLQQYPFPNVRYADYVWLPIRFDGEMAYIDWHDEWRVEDYE